MALEEKSTGVDDQVTVRPLGTMNVCGKIYMVNSSDVCRRFILNQTLHVPISLHYPSVCLNYVGVGSRIGPLCASVCVSRDQ